MAPHPKIDEVGSGEENTFSSPALAFFLALTLIPTAHAQDGETLFRQQCAGCHRLDDRRAFGPSLRGVANRPAASVEGFRYSPAMRASGLVWDAANLRRFLAAPRDTVPGTAMAFVGLRDPARLEALVDYVLTLSPPAAPAGP